MLYVIDSRFVGKAELPRVRKTLQLPRGLHSSFYIGLPSTNHMLFEQITLT